jgi:serine protease
MGTSMATPHVSAVVALLISQGITDPAAIRVALENTAEDLGPTGFDNQFGHGLVRPVDALRGLGFNR